MRDRTAIRPGAGPSRPRAGHAGVRSAGRAEGRAAQRVARCVARLSSGLSEGCGRMGRMSRESREPEDGGSAEELPEYAERVLEVAELIPSGRVMTYGDVAEWLEEGGPRQVGRVMALYGGAVPWWRVVRADGVLLPGHELRALDHYREEGTPLREAARSAEGHVPRIDMARARWDGGGQDHGR
ncbi:MGMT family protein [Streptomyces asiaticus]|uniref:MGMT family protein n=3 Tax=Streptomyces TaxID=1883 RepID=A0ABN1SME2_9ACTN